MTREREILRFILSCDPDKREAAIRRMLKRIHHEDFDMSAALADEAAESAQAIGNEAGRVVAELIAMKIRRLKWADEKSEAA